MADPAAVQSRKLVTVDTSGDEAVRFPVLASAVELRSKFDLRLVIGAVDAEGQASEACW